MGKRRAGGKRRAVKQKRKPWWLAALVVIGLGAEGAGATYALTLTDGLRPHDECNATAVPTAPNTALIFSLQPDVRADVTIESVKLTGVTPGMEIVGLGYRAPDSQDSKYTDDPATIVLSDVRGLKLSPDNQQAFSAIVRAADSGIFSVTGFDVTYKQGFQGRIKRTVHYSDAFAFRAGISPESVNEVRFVDCERWELAPQEQ